MRNTTVTVVTNPGRAEREASIRATLTSVRDVLLNREDVAMLTRDELLFALGIDPRGFGTGQHVVDDHFENTAVLDRAALAGRSRGADWAVAA